MNDDQRRLAGHIAVTERDATGRAKTVGWLKLDTTGFKRVRFGGVLRRRRIRATRRAHKRRRGW